MNDLDKTSIDTLLNIRRKHLHSDHALQALKFLYEEFNVRSVTEESKQSNVSRQTVYNRIKTGNLASIELNSKTYIIY